MYRYAGSMASSLDGERDMDEAGIDAKTAPTVGIILQKSHINTKDDTHYVSLIAELESR